MIEKWGEQRKAALDRQRAGLLAAAFDQRPARPPPVRAKRGGEGKGWRWCPEQRRRAQREYDSQHADRLKELAAEEAKYKEQHAAEIAALREAAALEQQLRRLPPGLAGVKLKQGRPRMDERSSAWSAARSELERRFAHYLRAVILRTPRVAAAVTATAAATSSDEIGSTTSPSM